ncbi:MAG: lipoprotein [Gammaproteobacteria bacterium]|nr:lipoprotein [Gammaproteobacteria bacterium]NIR98684.1 lipoprotein [Gammaproteobacteria bacterium]NIT64396.1 lipoprotein [Gammaproteobacteria bacterium]NIV19495.1 hypothetical protein [Gammaproteobacteria bacterium]NIY32976.1 hypothetical protein [Gammaproteobacteria bacterium]
MPLFRLLAIVLGLALAAPGATVLSGCGQKGPLYLPDRAAQHTGDEDDEERR